MRQQAETIVNAVLNDLRARSNYAVDIVLHGSLDSEDRYDRLDTEDALYQIVELLLEGARLRDERDLDERNH